MYLLGIETSCDETSAAVLTDDNLVLSNIVLSQDDIHAPFGGVVPEMASRQHIASIEYVVGESLEKAGLKLPQIDAFAVTQGPGLIGSLLIGVSFAKGLAYYFQKPLIPVDHLESHIHAVFLENKTIPFPAVALLVSGGHTSLFLLKEKLSFELLVKTRDDAAGEALDKIAKYLGLGYPGGPVIDLMAAKGDPQKFPFSLPRMTDQTLGYSFSGLKTAALKTIKENAITLDHPQLENFLASFQSVVIKALLAPLDDIIQRYAPQSLILCGGVARNSLLRFDFQALAEKNHLKGFVPSPQFCTDNAAMVAALALEKFKNGGEFPLSLNLNAYPSKLIKAGKIKKF
ncbi:MAG: tRNA (adenosine(37)-N6)-threonylcarbamoyltransferase complex transferase subunit TsaD [Candidatus Aminicenantes bacterium]|nr:tRNA (adenosine(37)-N6)-threonylcarbamoyltransferase complex transferase subunit TsaD [Candidatus Aminicenantes bacterium]